MSDYARVKAVADLKEYAAQHLTKSRGNYYCCPVCGSGTHGTRDSDGDLSITDDGNHWECFACHANGDIFDLAGAIGNTDSKAEQLRIVADWAGVTLEHGTTDKGRGFQSTWNARKATEKAAETQENEKGTDTPKPDYTEGRERHRRYIAECAKRLEEQPTDEIISYLSARGITHDEAVMLGLGYDPNPKNGWYGYDGKWNKSPRLVIPWAGCDYYHIDRAIDSNANKGKYDKPKSSEVGGQPVYNPEAFNQPYVIVVEGALDAIAIQLCGYNAVAAGGTDVNPIANEAAARNYDGVVIDMLDADGDAGESEKGKRKGRGAGADLVSLLGKAGITCLPRAEYGVGETDNYNGFKDAGEWLEHDRDTLKDKLEEMRGLAIEKGKNAKDAEYREALRSFHVKNPAVVADDVLNMRGVYEPVPTGIKPLDDALNGGLSLGETTFMGAISSYGKTTLAVQIADHMAAAGRSVLFVTIEQSAKEIVAKSLSRLAYTDGTIRDTIITPQEITSLKKRRELEAWKQQALEKAVGDYARMIAPNLLILEGNKQPTVADIRAVAEKMKEHNGQAPIVFIDYLQLLAPLSARVDNDKRNADMNVSELRKMARDLVTHVWCISSLNRSSYSGVISLDSFKESGGIEYGADNLLGLQPEGMEYDLDGVSEAKMKREADKIVKKSKRKTKRDCELVVLKQRNGAMPDDPLPLTFKPMVAYFMEPVHKDIPTQAVERDEI